MTFRHDPEKTPLPCSNWLDCWTMYKLCCQELCMYLYLFFHESCHILFLLVDWCWLDLTATICRLLSRSNVSNKTCLRSVNRICFKIVSLMWLWRSAESVMLLSFWKEHVLYGSCLVLNYNEVKWKAQQAIL